MAAGASGTSICSHVGSRPDAGLDSAAVIEQRFLAGFAEEATDDPGLVLGQDGVVYVVLPDGSRRPVTGEVGGGVEMFLHGSDEGSPFSGYYEWLAEVSNDPEQTAAAVVKASTGQRQLEIGGNPWAWITAAEFPGVTVFPSGAWLFDTWLDVSAAGGVTTVTAKVYKRSTENVETLLFETTSPELAPGLVNVPWEHAFRNISLEVDDRFVVKYFAQSTANANKTVTLYFEGAANYSHVHLPYRPPASVT